MFRAPVYFFLGAVVVYLLQRAIQTARNYVEARKLGLPIILLPISWQDPLWLVFRDRFTWISRLPFGLGRWERFSFYAWSFTNPYETHHKLGDAIMLVSAGKNEIVIADPTAGAEVMSKYKIWHKPPNLYRPFRIFGPSVASTNTDDWQRHRKITAPAFLEQHFKAVWIEALKQGQQMCDVIQKHPDRTLAEVKNDLTTAVLHVLTAATTSQRYEYEKGVTEISPGHRQSYATVTNYTSKEILRLMLFKNLQLPAWLKPRAVKELQDNAAEFLEYMKESVALHLADLRSGSPRFNDLVGALVAANEKEKGGQEKTEKPIDKDRMYLTTEELYGNLYMFNLAGFETTTNALAFAVPYLAANPQTQEWVAAEVNSRLQHNSSPDYDETFHNLPRCMAVMYETLRLSGAVQALARHNTEQALTLRLKSRDIVVPAETLITVNFTYIHVNPQFWGQDSLEWRPERWIEVDSSSGSEKLKQAPKETVFMPWSIGPRVCPGKRLSQVEFVAIISTILSRYRLKPKTMLGEDAAAATANLKAVIADSIMKIFPVIRRPLDASVVFESRSG